MIKLIAYVTLFIVSITFAPQKTQAQYYFYDGDYYDNPVLYEAGISVGAMNCLTDLGGKKGVGTKFLKDLNLGYTHISAGFFFGVAYKNAVELRLEGTFGKVSSRDVVLKGITDIAKERFNRNLDFSSRILEVGLVAEIYPTNILIDWPAKDYPRPRTAPYLVAGINYFSFNPQTKIGNRFIDLQTLHTEGQGFPETGRKDYKLNQFNVSYGFGAKYEVSPLVNLRLEYIYRHLFTDYLDDLSTTYIDPALFDKYLSPQKAATAKLLYDKQIVKVAGVNGKRGTETNNDGYFTINLKISLIIGRERLRR